MRKPWQHDRSQRVNNFRGAPGSGDCLCTNKCLTLGSLTSSACIIPAAENIKQARNTILARTSFSIFSFGERVVASGLRLVRNWEINEVT